jgi:hypothetical protein
LLGDGSHTARLGEPDRAIDRAGVVERRVRQHIADSPPEVHRRRDRRQRGKQQDHAEVRVRGDHPARRRNRPLDGQADPVVRRAVERLGDRQGAREEVDEMEAGQVPEPMDVARLRGHHLEHARELRQPARAEGRPGRFFATHLRRNGHVEF